MVMSTLTPLSGSNVYKAYSIPFILATKKSKGRVPCSRTYIPSLGMPSDSIDDSLSTGNENPSGDEACTTARDPVLTFTGGQPGTPPRRSAVANCWKSCSPTSAPLGL